MQNYLKKIMRFFGEYLYLFPPLKSYYPFTYAPKSLSQDIQIINKDFVESVIKFEREVRNDR